MTIIASGCLHWACVRPCHWWRYYPATICAPSIHADTGTVIPRSASCWLPWELIAVTPTFTLTAKAAFSLSAQLEFNPSCMLPTELTQEWTMYRVDLSVLSTGGSQKLRKKQNTFCWMCDSLQPSPKGWGVSASVSPWQWGFMLSRCLACALNVQPLCCAYCACLHCLQLQSSRCCLCVDWTSNPMTFILFLKGPWSHSNGTGRNLMLAQHRLWWPWCNHENIIITTSSDDVLWQCIGFESDWLVCTKSTVSKTFKLAKRS